MSPFADQIQQVIARHRMLIPRDQVLVGVSGGADSVALVKVLGELGYSVAIAHLNHALRGAESDKDEAFVAELATKLGALFHAGRIDVAETGGNLEAAGRAARKEFFRSLCDRHGYNRIALGHNRDDRVETFLFNLMRGSGSEGLVSMAPAEGNIVRPLIESTREQIEAYLSQSAQTWRTDATNSDKSFTRNKIRHEVLPLLASLFNTRLPETLSRTLTLLQDEDSWLQDLTADCIATSATSNDLGEISLDATKLEQSPVALVRRVIRELLRQAGSDLNNLTFDHVEAIRGLLQDGKSGKVVQLPGGMQGAREFNQLVLRPDPGVAMEFLRDLKIPGEVHIPECGCTLRAELVEQSRSGTEFQTVMGRVYADAERTGNCVQIRNWKPGDYYRPAGWPGGKIKKLFNRARIPRSRRRRWPILVSGSSIIWVISFPVSEEFAVSRSSEKIVAFDALPD